ncbi:MAG: class III poly(R)-hydroxyalkanoic acid synthase subunit PhaC, partial [Alphaproteobacteria bacterium]|nr:class III poly(R)-hydroxyalkanoic acid synthase subunit PhaC [Alphaproteobacteria bacterium]
MIAVQLSPDRIFREVTRFNTKLARGVKNLRSVGEIPSGVTPKEEVYREDKMVLYRYKNPNGKKTAANKTPLLINYAL